MPDGAVHASAEPSSDEHDEHAGDALEGTGVGVVGEGLYRIN